jgi:hypothetical protein
MISVYCDVCRKKMDNPITGGTFFYYADFSVCEACKDSLEVQLKSQIRAKEPFGMDWYERYVNDIFSKAVQKGKA